MTTNLNPDGTANTEYLNELAVEWTSADEVDPDDELPCFLRRQAE